MGLKTKLYVFLSSILLLIIVGSFALLVGLARDYIEQDTEQRVLEIADLASQDIVVANITNDFIRLDQRLSRYAKQSVIKRISWTTSGQKPMIASSNAELLAPDWFRDLFTKNDMNLTQPIDWFGASYGELRIEGDSTNTINGLWFLMLFWLVFLAAIALVVIAIIETLARPITQQIESLCHDAMRIGAGQWNEPVRIGGSDEVLQLSVSMDQMRSALKEYQIKQQEQQRHIVSISEQNETRLMWLNKLLETLPLAVLLEDEMGKVVFLNQRYCDFFDLALAPKQIIGKERAVLMKDAQLLFANPAEFAQKMSAALSAPQLAYQQRLAMQGGRWILLDFLLIRSERTGAVLGRLWLFQDVTANYQLEQKLRWQADHDALTGLLNRTAFEQKLSQMARISQQSHALLYLDLDQFKLINDTAGHIAGDELLKQVAARLESMLPKSTLLARMGGDEFALIAPLDVEAAMALAEETRVMINRFQFVYLDHNYQISTSIGVVPNLGSESDAKMVMAMADAACYAAKHAGRNTLWLYQTSDAYLRNQQDEMRIVTELHSALELNQFELFAQQIVALQQAESQLHIEILLRWRGKEGQYISPALFISAAEKYGLMHLIDQWVIEHTLMYLAEHPSLLSRIAVCAINLSGASFSQPDLASFVCGMLEKTGVPANKICFEITETAAVTQLDQAQEFMLQLKAVGCQFALDDFGSGQSSFRYLKQLPVDYLKIDGSFVKSMLEDRTNAALVRGMQEIAHSLGMLTIAEFVETAAIAQSLKDIHVDYAQGWNFHKAQPIQTLLED